MAKHALKIGTLTMPYTSKIEYGGEIVGTETQMASGALASDIIGFRPTITYTYDYLPATTMQTLHALLRTARYFNCSYITPEGTVLTGVSCKVDYPSADYWIYRGGVAVWHNAVITLTRREVIVS